MSLTINTYSNQKKNNQIFTSIFVNCLYKVFYIFGSVFNFLIKKIYLIPETIVIKAKINKRIS